MQSMRRILLLLVLSCSDSAGLQRPRQPVAVCIEGDSDFRILGERSVEYWEAEGEAIYVSTSVCHATMKVTDVSANNWKGGSTAETVKIGKTPDYTVYPAKVNLRAETWVGRSEYWKLAQIAHELGHVLWIPHTTDNDPTQMMYPRADERAGEAAFE